MKEYESLKSTNESLKAQLNLNGVAVNVEVEETQQGLKFNNAHKPTPTSSSTQQLYISNHPSSLPYVFATYYSMFSYCPVCTSKWYSYYITNIHDNKWQDFFSIRA